MSIARFIQVLRARWRLAALVLTAIVVLAVTASLLQPKQYKATASVLVDMRSPDPLAGTVLGSMMTTGYMATQMDLVQSERVARRAISILGLDRDEKLRSDWRKATNGQGDFESWLTDELLRKLDVQPTRESGVMTITFTALDPRLAANVTNAFVRGYIDTTLELRVEPARNLNSFFDERAVQLRNTLEDAQARLSAYQQANGVVVSDERLDVESMRLAELSSQLVGLQATAADSSSRERQAGTHPERTTDVSDHPAVSALSAELQRQQLRLGELSQRLGEEHPQVLDVRNGIATLRTQIDAERRRVAAGLGANSQINRSREAQIKALLDEQRAKVLRLTRLRDEATVLQRDVENARQAYDAVQQRARQTGLESRITQTNVSVLRQATPPAMASWPKLSNSLAASLVLGSLLAVAAVLLREMNDRRMRTVEDVVDLLRQPLLVVLPHARLQAASGTPGEARASGASGAKARILGGLFRPAMR